MKSELTSKKDFETKVHNSEGGMLLLFHSDNPAEDDIKIYINEAKKKCGYNYPVYTINIDRVFLSKVDIQKYQEDVVVICCTVLMNDKVLYRKVNPQPAELWKEIEC
ncbi:MAG: hypothetical protein H8D45_02885 [Bacteroidetes bacterium]|nr:hypothetical protein [Bacteroidota bacterium]